MSVSRRHHYIPQFLASNFTDVDGVLFVYNKDEDRIVSKKQSPKAMFFEKDRNTVEFNGQKLDDLEKLYSVLDDKISRHLRSVLTSKTISPEQVVSIALLASQLKWRVPNADEAFNKIKEGLTQEDLAISITAKDQNLNVDEEAIKFIENSEIFRETKRVLLSMPPFLNEQSLLEIHNNSFINTNPNFPALIGDAPVLEKPNTDWRRIEDFIFPLSSSDTLIFKKGTKKEIVSPLFYFQRDMATIKASTKYVGCKSKDHLEKIVKMYQEVRKNGKLNNVEEFLFDFIR